MTSEDWLKSDGDDGRTKAEDEAHGSRSPDLNGIIPERQGNKQFDMPGSWKVTVSRPRAGHMKLFIAQPLADYPLSNGEKRPG